MTAPEHNPNRAPLPSEKSTKSFWHKEPSQKLLGLRSTEELPANADVVIIGSGIAGAFAAWELLEGGDGKGNGIRSLVMLEAREACWGATGRNGGHCQPNVYIPPPHISNWELSNFSYLRSFISTHNIPCSWQDTQGVHGFYSQPIFDMAVLDAAANALLDPELGKQVHIVRPGDTEPEYNFKDLRLGETCVGAIVEKNAASLWPYKLVCWVLETLLRDFPVRKGPGSSESSSGRPTFNIQTLTPCTSLTPSKAGSGMGWVLTTPRGNIHADEVLLCTNAYTSHLLPSFTDLIVPVRGQMSALNPPRAVGKDGEALSGRYSYGFVGNAGQTSKQGDYLVQRPTDTGGELMFGGGRGAASAFGMPGGNRTGDDSFIDDTVATYLRMQLNNELALDNKGEELEASHEWSGIMGFSRDGYPWVGEVPMAMDGGERLYVCAGFTGHGMANASLAARWVAQSMRNGGSTTKSLYQKGDVGVEVFGGGKDKDEVKMPREMVVSVERAERARGYLAVNVVDLVEDDLHL